MKYLIISFKSRNELYGYARIIKSNGINFSIINSPKSIGSSCMLSIKTDFRHLNAISQLLRNFQPKSFLGLYSVLTNAQGDQILRLI